MPVKMTITVRIITSVISVKKMKSGLLPKTEFSINFTWQTGL